MCSGTSLTKRLCRHTRSALVVRKAAKSHLDTQRWNKICAFTSNLVMRSVNIVIAFFMPDMSSEHFIMVRNYEQIVVFPNKL